MTSREQFEAEMAKLGDIVDMRRAKNGDMGYMAWDVSLAWRMWQASREAVEVVLPQRQSLCASGYGNGYFVACNDGEGLEYDDVVEAIRAAGVNVIEGEKNNG